MARALRCAIVFFGCVILAAGCVPPSWTCATNADCNVGSSCVDGACEPAPLFDGGVDGGGGEDAGPAVDAGQSTDAGEPAEDAGESTDGGGPEAEDRDPADGGVPGEGEGEGEGPLDDGRS